MSKNDFMDLGGDDLVRKALSSLEGRGTIRRVLRGLYDYPHNIRGGIQMNRVASLAPDGRNELFALTAERRGFGSVAVVEKDFWAGRSSVCSSTRSFPDC